MTRVDVVVVGAGPAGALAAREAARAGASVLMLDRSVFPRGKVCGACLSPGAMAVLESVDLGDLPARLAARPLSTMLLSVGRRRVRLDLDGSMALSRAALDHALAEVAEAEGAEFWQAAKATLGDVRDGRRTLRVHREGQTVDVEARIVLDATGLGRGLPVPGEAPPTVAPDSRVGVGATFSGSEYPVGDGELHMAVGGSGYVGMVRLECGALNVAAAMERGALRAAEVPHCVAEVLASVGLPPLPEGALVPWRGTPTLTRAAADVGAERLLRIGDAAGYVEPFTGEGMCWALAGARAVVPLALAAVEGWSPHLLDEWRTYHRLAMGRARRLSRVLAPALRQPWLVAVTLQALTLMPGLAAPFVRRAARPPSPLQEFVA